MNSKTKGSSDYTAELDGIRGIAASMVVFYHGTSLISQHWLDSIYARLIAFGHTGVDLFFVLSGYLITAILVRDIKKNNPIHFFYVRRILRIVPLLFLLVIVLGLGPVFFRWWPFMKISKGDLIATLLFFSNAKMACLGYFLPNFLGCTWSVSLEEQFYLIWPTLIRKLSHRHFIIFCTALVPVSFVLRWILAEAQVSPVFLQTMLFTRLDALAFGALVFLLNDRFSNNKRALGWSYRIFVLGICLMLLLEFFERGQYPYWGNIIGFTVLGISYGALLFAALNSSNMSLLRRFLRQRVFTIPGKLCYGVYLLHGPVIAISSGFFLSRLRLDRLNALGLASIPDFVRELFFVAVTLIVSGIVYRIFERPFLSLQTRFR